MFQFSSFRSLLGVALIFVLLPFFLMSTSFEGWIEAALAIELEPIELAGILFVLLTVDAVLPLPSSYVVAVAMSRFDGMTGLAIVFLGLFLSSIMAYHLGKLTKVDAAGKRVRDGEQYDTQFPRSKQF